jgi:predicted phage tail protein
VAVSGTHCFGGDDSVSLRSRAILKILFLLSEGEISGFPSGKDIRKYIYINDVAVMNPDDTFNLRGIKATWRWGTQSQTAISGVSQGAASPTSVGVQVKKSAAPIVRTITNSLADQIRVTLYTPGLSRTDDEGHIHYSEAAFKIYLSTNGSPFVLKVTDSFYGRTSGGYARDYTMDVSGTGPWQIKVERTSNDVNVSNTKESNDLYWQSFTPIVEQKFRYPNSALLYVEFDSAYFKSTPTITVKLDGVICRIPSNYNPVTRVYTGLWDGTFYRAWTNNPAWCLLELLTNSRFGTGSRIPIESVDKWSLYAISKYCDGLVNDGFGGLEPRFVYNNYLNSKQDAFTTISSILGQIRGVAYYANGQILFNQDRPDIEPVDLYTLANTVCEYNDNGILTQPNFTYDYVSLKEKHAKCHVYWYDPNEFGKKKTAYIDLYDIGYGNDFYRYGDEVKEIDLPGCTSEAEARRHGRWLLLTERLESKTVSFATGEAGKFRFPGDLIKVADPYETGNRTAGKIVSSTLSTITVDDPVTIGTGTNTLSVIINGIEQIRTIANSDGTHAILTTTTPFTAFPTIGSIWLVSGATTPETYRVISIGYPDLGKYAIMGVLHAGKYAAIDSLETLTADSPNRTRPEAPTQLKVTSIPNGYFVGWLGSVSRGVTEYKLEVESENSGFWQPIPLGSGVSDAEVILPVGNYRFRVQAINIYGRLSDFTYSSLSYATQGTILAHLDDGTIVLSSEVELLPNTTYYLRSTCDEGAGSTTAQIASPYIDRRKIVTPAGITNKVEVSPNYLGNNRSLIAGSYPDLELYDNVTYVRLTSGTAILYSGANYTGTSTTISAGTYYNPAGQAPPRSVVVAGGTLNISQYKPGVNPLASSTWQISTDPLEAITAGGLPITASTGSITV